MAKKIEIPRDILWDMHQDMLLPNVILGNDLNKSQAVECTPEMEAWCRKRAEAVRATDPNMANHLDVVAGAIRRCLQSN